MGIIEELDNRLRNVAAETHALRRRVEALEAREKGCGADGTCGAFCDPDTGTHERRCRYAPQGEVFPGESMRRAVIARSKAASFFDASVASIAADIRKNEGLTSIADATERAVKTWAERHGIGAAAPIGPSVPDLRWSAGPAPTGGHCPHTPCCHCQPHSNGCPGDAAADLDDDMRYESRGS